jgi:hypothetical protein
MPKRTAVDRQARALCGELARVTGGRPVQWRMLHEIEERLGFDEKATAAALLAAVERGWIQIDQLAEKREAPPHGICLTNKGLSATRPKAK